MSTYDRRVARAEQSGIWDNAVKDIAKFNRLVSKIEKKPTDTAALQDVKKMKGLAWWLALCFDDEADPASDALSALRNNPSPESLFDFRGKLRSLMSGIAPEHFNYSGFNITNPERLSDRLSRKTLEGVDFLIALFKKRGVSKLLQEGVTGIRILPADPIGSSGGSYNRDTQLITLDAPKDGGGGRKVFIDLMAHAFLHEFGHHVHTNFLPPPAVAAWDAPWDYPEGDKPTSVSQYGGKSKFEDFAETFVAFMAAPEKLTPSANFRMQRALSLSGLYGKPVLRLASSIPLKVVERFRKNL